MARSLPLQSGERVVSIFQAIFTTSGLYLLLHSGGSECHNNDVSNRGICFDDRPDGSHGGVLAESKKEEFFTNINTSFRILGKSEQKLLGNDGCEDHLSCGIHDSDNHDTPPTTSREVLARLIDLGDDLRKSVSQPSDGGVNWNRENT